MVWWSIVGENARYRNAFDLKGRASFYEVVFFRSGCMYSCKGLGGHRLVEGLLG